MIFRNIHGELIEMNRFDFKNDKLFFQKIVDTKKPFTKIEQIEQIKQIKQIKQIDDNKKLSFTNYVIKNALNKNH